MIQNVQDSSRFVISVHQKPFHSPSIQLTKSKKMNFIVFGYQLLRIAGFVALAHLATKALYRCIGVIHNSVRTLHHWMTLQIQPQEDGKVEEVAPNGPVVQTTSVVLQQQPEVMEMKPDPPTTPADIIVQTPLPELTEIASTPLQKQQQPHLDLSVYHYRPEYTSKNSFSHIFDKTNQEELRNVINEKPPGYRELMGIAADSTGWTKGKQKRILAKKPFWDYDFSNQMWFLYTPLNV